MDSQITKEELREILRQHDLELLSDIDSLYNSQTISIYSKIDCKDSNGYKYYLKLSKIINADKRYIAYPTNPFSIFNINRYLKLNNVNFKCISDEYVSATSNLDFICLNCGTIVHMMWRNVNRKNTRTSNRGHIICPSCGKRTESIHALLLKQVFLHEYKDTIPEEPSCINPLTSKSMPTDIVNHRLKIAIEIQSQWHDFEDKKPKDAYKKSFWIEKGYSFYEPDIRDYSVLEMVQLFFPNIDKIPDYIDYNYSNKINIKEIQVLIDKGETIPSIEKITGINRHRIYDAIYDGRLIRGENTKNASFMPVVQLDINLNFIREYDSISDAFRCTGIKTCAIDTCLRKGRHFSGGFFWYYKDDYDIGKINPKSRFLKFYIPVDKYDLQGNFIQSYSSIIEASKNSNVSNSQIYNVIIGKLKQTGGFVYRKAA